MATFAGKESEGSQEESEKKMRIFKMSKWTRMQMKRVKQFKLNKNRTFFLQISSKDTSSIAARFNGVELAHPMLGHRGCDELDINLRMELLS